MKLFVGLGNIGDQYKYTRHNAGFILLDTFCHNNNIEFNFDKKLNSFIGKSKNIIFCKPNSYINVCGIYVLKVIKYYNIDYKNIVVIHDELDLDFGKIKFSCNRGSAGHKGVLDIINKISTKDFCRLRIGIGKPKDKRLVDDFVLQNFSNNELVQLKNIDLLQQILVEQS